MFSAIHPILGARDLEKALAFYVDRLGFQLAFRDDHSREVKARLLDHTDAQFDRLVYELSGLSADEFAIVEGATA